MQVESYIESLRRRSKVRLRTTSSTTSGSPPVSRWSRGSAASDGSSGGNNYMADLSAAARDAAAAAAEADAAAALHPPAQDPAAGSAAASLKSASLRAPSVVLPLPAVPAASASTAPATAPAMLRAASPADSTARAGEPKALLPTSEAVSAVSSYLDSLRGLSARGVSNGQMGGLHRTASHQPNGARQTGALSMPALDLDPMPRSQTTPEAAAAAAVGGYLASLRSQSQMRGHAGGTLPWQRVHALTDGANPQHAPVDAAKAAKAAAVAAAMFGSDEDEDDDDEQVEGDDAVDAGAEASPAAAAVPDVPDVDEGDADLRTGSLACLSLRDDPSTAGQFASAATAAVASVRRQSQLRSASAVLPSQQRQQDARPHGAGGADDDNDLAIKRASASSDVGAAPFKAAYSPFTAMAEAASKSSSASSEGNARSDGAQVIACAPPLPLPAALPAPRCVTPADRESPARCCRLLLNTGTGIYELSMLAPSHAGYASNISPNCMDSGVYVAPAASCQHFCACHGSCI